MNSLKNFITAVALLLTLAPLSHADLKGAPYQPEVDCRFNALEGGATMPSGCSGVPIGSVDGNYTRHYLKATYDFSKSGGSSTVNGGVIDLGVQLPANAIITRSFLYSVTQPTTSASGTLAFYCASSAGTNVANIKLPLAAASWPAAGAAVDGLQSGGAANFSVVTPACNLKAKVATADLTAGKVSAYIDYVIHQ